MRIIFINRFYAPDHSATSQMLTDLASALAAGGADVFVVASRLRYDDPTASLAKSEAIGGVAVQRVWTSAFGRGILLGRAADYLSFYLTASWRCLRLTRKGDVVVAMTDPPLISVPIGWIVRMRGARLVNWLQDIFPEVAAQLGMRGALGAGGNLLRRLRDRSLRQAAANVVLGRRMKDRLTKLGIASGRISVIHNWADGSTLYPIAREVSRLRPAWDLGDMFVVGYSGNMGRVHEFDAIIGAAAALATQSDIRFLFIGDGAQKAAIEAAATERGLPNLTFRPYQPRDSLCHSLGAADVHLVTLRPELEGLVVPSKFYGIAAVGRPTIFIGDPDGEIGTVIREAECGVCVRQGDAPGLAAAILKLRDDVVFRGQLGSYARQAFDECFDKPIAIARWRRLLDDVAAGRLAQSAAA